MKKSQPRRDYMNSVKEIVDSCLIVELKKQKFELNGIECLDEYHLTFGKNGKLKAINISDYIKPTLKNSLGLVDYLYDKKEIRKCKSKIKHIFRKIDLGFLNLETEIYRTFSFENQTDFILSDNTIY